MKLENGGAIVAGAAGGIGTAIAKSLGTEGARVVLVDRDEASCDAAARRLAAHGFDATGCAADVTVPEANVRCVQQALDACGRLDAFVANAGIAAFGDLTDGEALKVRRTVDTNLLGAVQGCTAALRPMLQQRSGVLLADRAARNFERSLPR
ncbi:MAG: SDR family NAD(P)-dependent oxidoreductase [Steroidobacteraceae bacterium]|jgi:3-oxoacyl-[acyl-carrier protein] reductase|nr:SDR family NAD(P)-dependent oxidoreductase [Steroidobacteraceae bacterium]